jgi:nucleotide-binding universal stress UspA family protein
MSDVISNRLPVADARTLTATPEAVGKMRIVVGVSGSPASALALRWAAAAADRLSAALKIVLIWTTEPRAYYAPAISAAEYDRRHERAVAGLAATVNAVAGHLPADTVSMTVVQGLPERALAEQSAGADLLVLGSAASLTGGRSIGPVIRACLSHAHCPVLVVGPDGPTSQSWPSSAATQRDPTAIQDERDLALAGPARTAASAPERRSR